MPPPPPPPPLPAMAISFVLWTAFASIASSFSVSAADQNGTIVWGKPHLSGSSILSEPYNKQTQHLELNFSYMSNSQLEKSMKDFARKCHNIARLYSIGKSFMGFPLWVLEIADKPGEEEAEPSFKYIGNMHGDEPVGRELLLLLANWLCNNYLKDPLATFIVRNSHLHLLPSMNPDGFIMKRRSNANNVDLNRDFPDQFYLQNNDEILRQPETQAVMNWTRAKKFVASASLHGGALVANYPWDGNSDGRTMYSKCPDDSTFRYLASVYSRFHANMSHSEEFTDGITNGAAWYPLYGGMQDWNYIYGKCFDLTLEISEQKWPPPIEVLRIWEENRLSMLQLAANVIKSGIHGGVVSSLTAKPLPAIISVDGIDQNVTASKRFGYYHRLLSPGINYKVTASLPGYSSSTSTVIVLEGRATHLDFVLNPLDHEYDETQVLSQLRGTQPADDLSSNHLDSATGSSETAREPRQMHYDDQKERAEPYPADIAMDISQHSMSKEHTVKIERKQLKTTYDGDLIADLVTQHLKVTSICFMAVIPILCLCVLLRWRSPYKLQKLLHFRRLLPI